MICSTCNATISAGDVFCGSCGARQAAAPASPAASMALDPQAVERVKEGAQAAARLAQDIGVQVGKSNAFQGLLVLIVSFFMMPIHSVKAAGRLLSEIGESGALDRKTEFPHLTWIMTVLPLISTITFFLILLFGFGKGLQLADNPYVDAGLQATGDKAGIMFKYFASTVAAAYAANWIIMFFGELLGIILRGIGYSRHQLVLTREQSANISAIAAVARDSGRL